MEDVSARDKRIYVFQIQIDPTILFQNQIRIQNLTVLNSKSCLNSKSYRSYKAIFRPKQRFKNKNTLETNSSNLLSTLVSQHYNS